ncbi:hypothetical protein L7F22_024910 [Adiantum nelumboides]|nr:hypothetical protein [Adiantum nelumboides]
MACSIKREAELVLKRTLEHIILIAMHPNTAIFVLIQVVDDDGGALACALNAACAALVDARVSLSNLIAAVSCVGDKHVLTLALAGCQPFHAFYAISVASQILAQLEPALSKACMQQQLCGTSLGWLALENSCVFVYECVGMCVYTFCKLCLWVGWK